MPVLIDIDMVTPPVARYIEHRAVATDSLVWLRELDELLTLENRDGLTLQAAPHVYKTVRDYLESMTAQLILPQPEFTPDADGGIEIEWQRQGRRLVASFKAAADDTDFISWREAQGRYDGREATKELLQDRLNWLLS